MKLWHLLLALSVIVILTATALSFRTAKCDPESIPVIPNSPLQLLILPHHDLAKPLSLTGLSTVTNTPKQIILLSPNHQEIGNCNICTYNPKVFAGEQGITTLLPLLQDKFPTASVSAYVFKRNTSLTEIDQFIKKINVANTLVIGSIDFSHYLTKQQADEKDLETTKHINNHDYQKIISLNSDYLDSPPVLIAILKLADNFGTSLNQIIHGNSADFTGQANNTTSYFVYSNMSKTKMKITTKNHIKIQAVGDIMLGRSVNTMIQKRKDFSFPVRRIISRLPQSDLFLTNLESPFTDNCPLTDTGMVFCADSRSVATLKTLGVTVASVANNHIGNQNQIGLFKTIDTLNQNNIKPISSNQVFKIKNTRIALIAFNDIPPYINGIIKFSEDSLVSQIKEIKNEADFIIVTPHWGNEYQMASNRQKTLARLAIDSGADLIIGHHPHWIQEIEEYKGKLIYYSLGNFIFDQLWSEETREGIIANIIVEDNKIISHSETPIFINSVYQPEIVTN